MARKSGPQSLSVGCGTINEKPSDNEMQLTLCLSLKTCISTAYIKKRAKVEGCGNIGRCICQTAGRGRQLAEQGLEASRDAKMQSTALASPSLLIFFSHFN